MIDWLRNHGAPTLWLTTGEHTRAAGFYERRGWRRVSVSVDGEARYESADIPAGHKIALRTIREGDLRPSLERRGKHGSEAAN